MEGSCLIYKQTRFIFVTYTIGIENKVLNVDDVIETANHFSSEEAADKMKGMLAEYNSKEKKTFEDILEFHVKFEKNPSIP